jgi:hypothetical protein
MKRAALVLALLLQGCVDKNLCQGHDGTCIGLTVRGSGSITQVDDLHIEVRVPNGDAVDVTRADTLAPSTDLAGPLVDLPVTTAVYLPAGVIDNSTITVQGRVAGAVLSDAESALVIQSGGHYELTLTLAAGSVGGVAACPTFALFCEDFEHDGTPADEPFPKWDPHDAVIIENPGGPMLQIALGIDHSESFRGAYSLMATANTTGQGILEHPIDPPQASGVVAVRAYLYVEAALTAPTSFVQITLSGGDGSNNLDVGAGASSASAKDGGYWQLVLGDGTVTYGGKSAPVAYGAWMCVEAVLDLDNKTASLYATDAFAPDINAPPVMTMDIAMSSATGFEVGLPYAQLVQGVWFDDLAYATQRIGCE